MMAGRLVEDARAVLHPAALGVVGAEIEAADAGQGNRRGAHRAGLQRDVEVAAVELLLPERGGCGAQHQHLGVLRRVVLDLDAVAGFGDDHAVGPNEHRADRHLAAPTRREGRVAIDGTVLTSPAVNVTEANDIRVDGMPLPEAQRARLWRYHKPAGLITTHRDEKGRATVFAALPKELPRLISVGRLDLNSEGLLLLTNDGALARRLELPATGWLRRYKVRVHGIVEPSRLVSLEKGVTIDGVAYGPIRAQLERQQGSNAWIAMSLREGKNREVRKVLEHLGLPVTRLIRLSYGPFQLGNLARGALEEVQKSVLADQLGKSEPKAHAGRRSRSAK